MRQFEDVEQVILQAKRHNNAQYNEFIKCLTILLRYSSIRRDIVRLRHIDVKKPEEVAVSDIADHLDFINQLMQETFSRKETNDNKLINFLKENNPTSLAILQRLHNKNIDEMIRYLSLLIQSNYNTMHNFLGKLHERQDAYVSAMSWWEWTKYQSARLSNHIKNRTSLKLLTGFMHWGAEHITKKAPFTHTPFLRDFIPELAGASVQLLVFFPTLSTTLAKTSGKKTKAYLKALFSNDELLTDHIAAAGTVTVTYLYTAPLLTSITIVNGINLISTLTSKPDLKSASNLPRYPYLPHLSSQTALHTLNISLSITSAVLSGEKLLLVSGAAVLLGNMVVGKISKKSLGFLAKKYNLFSQQDITYYTLLITTGNSMLIRLIFNNIIEEVRMREALTQHFDQLAHDPETSFSAFDFPEFNEHPPYHPTYWFSAPREFATVYLHQEPGRYQFFQCSHERLLLAGDNPPCSALSAPEDCRILNETNLAEVVIGCKPADEDLETVMRGCELTQISPGSSSLFKLKVASGDNGRIDRRYALIPLDNKRQIEYVEDSSEPRPHLDGEFPCFV